MRILALRPEGYAVPFIHASMVNAFRSLGHEIIEFPFPGKLQEIKRLKALVAGGRDCFFSLDLPRNSNLRNRIKELQTTFRIPLIVWFVDDPDGYAFPEGCDPDWTIVFCWDGELTRELKTRGSWKGIDPIHLPLATDPGIFFPAEDGSPVLFPGGVFVGATAHSNRILDEAIRGCPDFEEEVSALWQRWRANLSQTPQELIWNYLEKKTGIGLCSLRENSLARLWVHCATYALGREKRKYVVSALIGKEGGVFGNREWNRVVGNTYRGKVAYGEPLRKIYNAASFVLETRQPQSRTGLTQRIFDAAACAIPILAEYSPELNHCFDSVDGVFSFNTIHEALEKKDYLLSLPEPGRRNDSGRNLILARHTYRHRAARIIEMAQLFFAFSRA